VTMRERSPKKNISISIRGVYVQSNPMLGVFADWIGSVLEGKII